MNSYMQISQYIFCIGNSVFLWNTISPGMTAVSWYFVLSRLRPELSKLAWFHLIFPAWRRNGIPFCQPPGEFIFRNCSCWWTVIQLLKSVPTMYWLIGICLPQKNHMVDFAVAFFWVFRITSRPPHCASQGQVKWGPLTKCHISQATTHYKDKACNWG